MFQNGSNRVLVCAASCLLVVSFVAFSNMSKDKDMQDNETEQKTEKVRGVACTPMFAYHNSNLSNIITGKAYQRAKRWMSFRLTGAQRMVGQVGGMSHQPILILDTIVMKPIRDDHRGIRELAFYEAIQASSKRSGFNEYCLLFSNEASKRQLPCDRARVEMETKLLYRLEPLTPRYYGSVVYTENSASEVEGQIPKQESDPYGIKSNSYIIMNNVTRTFSHPCVLDVKLGTQTYEPDATEEKKIYELGKYPLQKDLGFRLTAMRIYNPSSVDADEDGYLYYPKQFGRSLLTRDSVKESILTFLGGRELPKTIRTNRTSAIQRILTKLKIMKGWFRDNKAFAFYGSSILVIYEGDTVANDTDGVELDMAKAKMIDFGRVRRSPGGDEGCLHGITVLITLFEEILRESFLETSKYIRPARENDSNATEKRWKETRATPT